ncbi:hypothetical protein CRYUN_Cryun04dG0099000 [Craigia yunnanensis]
MFQWKQDLQSDRNFDLKAKMGLTGSVISLICFPFLPIKTIAQTSVLSKRWRSLWSSFPVLDFTVISTTGVPSTNIKPSGEKRSSPHSLSAKRMDFVSQILALRDKYSDLRILRFRAPLSFSRLNGLIRRATRQNVQELDVEAATDDYFNFPRSVVTSESLRVFKLRSRYPGFRLPPPPVMEGVFRSLQTFSLPCHFIQPTLFVGFVYGFSRFLASKN